MLCALSVTGCVHKERSAAISTHPADPLPFDEVSQWSDQLESVADAMPDRIDIVSLTVWTEGDTTTLHRQASIPLIRFGETRISGRSILREVLPHSEQDAGARALLRAAPNASSTVAPVLIRSPESSPEPTPDVSVYTRDEFTTSIRRSELVAPEIPYRLYSVYEPNVEEPAGIVLHLPGLAKTEYDRAIRDEMLRRGWVVIESQSWSSLSKTIRVVAREEDSGETAAAAIAQSLDELLARIAEEWASVLNDTLRNRTDLEDEPIVLMGYSAGAISGTTVASRLRDRLRAVVLVGGGVNITDISNRSSFASVIRIDVAARDSQSNRDFLTTPNPILLGRIARRYLELSKLDPFHSAPTIAHLPTLVLHGERDTWVPADTGEQLWLQLNQPERWSLPFDHGYLFWRLPSLKEQVADWVEQATRSTQAD